MKYIIISFTLIFFISCNLHFSGKPSQMGGLYLTFQPKDTPSVQIKEDAVGDVLIVKYKDSAEIKSKIPLSYLGKKINLNQILSITPKKVILISKNQLYIATFSIKERSWFVRQRKFTERNE